MALESLFWPSWPKASYPASRPVYPSLSLPLSRSRSLCLPLTLFHSTSPGRSPESQGQSLAVSAQYAPDWPDSGLTTSRCRAKRDRLERFQGLLPGSQGQNLSLRGGWSRWRLGGFYDLPRRADTYRTCPVQYFGRASTDLGRAAARDHRTRR